MTKNNTTDEFSEENSFHEVPKMINVLSILTFVGSGLTILVAILVYFIAPFIRSTNEKNMELINSQGGSGNEIIDNMMESSIDALNYMEEIYLGYFITAILCITGAFLMRKLKKLGFYIYSIATIISISVPFYFLGFGLASLNYIFPIIIGITFIILYGVNLKHLK